MSTSAENAGQVNEDGLASRLANIQRGVQLCIVIGLLWKIQFFLWSDKVYLDYRLHDPFFPDWLESLWTLRISFVLAALSGLIAMIFRRRLLLVCTVLIELVSLSVLLLHQGSYNDVTFLTSWWTSLWCLWLVTQSNSSDPVSIAKRAARLGCVILCLIMLGAAVGKWTSEYWSGDVLFDIYFRDREYWLFNWLREQYAEAELRQISILHSRVVIVVESLAGLTLWCLPTRIAGWLGILLMLAIPLTNNFLLFSVTLSLLGLSWAVIRLSPLTETKPFKRATHREGTRTWHQR